MSEPDRDAAWAWHTLGIGETKDPIEVRRAYSRALKAIDADTDRQGFIDLQEARNFVFYLLWQSEQDALAAEPGEPAPDRPPEPAPAAPEPAEPAPEPDGNGEPALDSALFARIEAMLFDAPEPPAWDALEAASDALLADPALDRIQTVAAVESWIAGTIYNAAPRSDPMLDPAIARFGWDAAARDWRRPPVIEWILKRRDDRNFEAWLIENQPRFGALLGLLRGTSPPLSGWQKWRRSPDMWALMTYIGANHPTTLHCSDPAAVEQWDHYLFRATGLRKDVDIIRRRWRGTEEDVDDIFTPRRELPGLYMVVGVFAFSYVFAWFLLRPVYHPLVRIAATVWLGFWILIIAFAGLGPDPAARPTLALAPTSNPAPAFLDPASDLDPMIGEVSGGAFGLAEIERRNPLLHRRLISRWELARRFREQRETFERGISSLLGYAYRDNVRGGGYAVQADYWRLYADRLKWLRRSVGAGTCVSLTLGNPSSTPLPPELRARERALMARALLDTPAQPRARDRSATFPIPGDVFAAGARRARLSPDAFDEALNRGGTADRRCGARIALIEAALAMPRARVSAFLRDMSSSI